jgi:cation:H+ antiporter
MLSTLLILAGFFVLIYGANFLVDGASSLASKYNVPNMVIGLTIVAFGTSAPELVVNVIAAIGNDTAIVMGNVIGSNIFNVAAILGLSAIITPLTVKSNTTWIEIPLSLLSAMVVLVLASDIFLDQSTLSFIGRGDGIILLLFFAVFLGYNIHLSLAGKSSEEIEVKDYSKLKSLLLIVLGLVMLVVGGRLIVTNAVKIAQLIGLSERVIALTIVSIGTSLPELATSLIAVRKKNVDLAIGNVVGSNIFNIFFILGISSVVTSVPVVDANLTDIFVNLIFSVMLFFFVFSGKGRKVERWEGVIFVLGYVTYVTLLLWLK